MRRGYEKVCMAAAVLAMSLSLSACGMDSLVDALGTSGKSQETAGETQEASVESQGAAAESQEASGETQEEPEESQGATADSQEVPERGENAPLHPLVQEQYLSDYDDSFRQLAYTEYASVGIRCADEKYAPLEAVLDRYNQDRKAEAERIHGELLEAAKADSEMNEHFYRYENVDSVDILRADEQVFSFVRENYDYMGGAHGETSFFCANLDAETGEELRLSDVISHEDAFWKYVEDELAKEYASQDLLLPGWEEQVQRRAADSEGGGPFVLSQSGIRVIFVPYELGPYALGAVTVEVPYQASEVGFNEAYVPDEGQSVWKLDPYEELDLDVDGDGREETIRYEEQTAGDGLWTSYVLTISSGEKTVRTVSAQGECDYGITRGYVMAKPAGGFVFYAECRSDNDWRYLSAIDLTELWTGNEEITPAIYYDAFYDHVPVSAESFYVSTRGYLLSTVSISREHCVGQDGLPTPLQEDYEFDSFAPTVKRDVPGIDPDSAQARTIPSGSQVEAVSTDEESYVIFRMTDSGELVKVEIDGAEWPHTIDGVDIQEYFEGLIFAG